MYTTLTTTRLRGKKSALGHGYFPVKHYLRLVFLCGPKVLLTSRISGKCAFVMMLMIAPSLLCCFMLTIPALIFQSPHQQAYFYFSKVLEEDPSRWIVLFLAGLCTLMSLAMPAVMAEPDKPIRF